MSSNDLSKIEREHLQRLAYVYIRQSSLHQVEFNTASMARQYNLVERVKELGWTEEKIIIVDQDQGQSGASLEGRDGFKLMMRDIVMGNVGAVFSLEASRLARDSSDWHLLVKLCITRNTLIIDEQGVHNPRVFNDRLLLSIKGTLSDAELHLITSRLNGGRLQRAKEGKLRRLLPAGYVYDTSGCIVFDPSPEVQETVRLLFDKFEELGSCLATVRYYRRHNLLAPNRHYDGRFHADTKLGQITYSRARSMLHNPIYAGIYVHGQTRTDIQVISSDTMETAGRRVLVPRRIGRLLFEKITKPTLQKSVTAEISSGLKIIATAEKALVRLTVDRHSCKALCDVAFVGGQCSSNTREQKGSLFTIVAEISRPDSAVVRSLQVKK